MNESNTHKEKNHQFIYKTSHKKKTLFRITHHVNEQNRDVFREIDIFSELTVHTFDSPKKSISRSTLRLEKNHLRKS